MSSLLGSNSRLLPLAFREAAVWQKSRGHHCAWSEFYLAPHMVLQPRMKLKCLCSRVVREQSITTRAIVSFLKWRDKAGHREWISVVNSIVQRNQERCGLSTTRAFIPSRNIVSWSSATSVSRTELSLTRSPPLWLSLPELLICPQWQFVYIMKPSALIRSDSCHAEESPFPEATQKRHAQTHVWKHTTVSC